MKCKYLINPNSRRDSVKPCLHCASVRVRISRDEDDPDEAEATGEEFLVPSVRARWFHLFLLHCRAFLEE